MATFNPTILLMRIYEIQAQDIPPKLVFTVRGLWVIELDNGETYYGCHTLKQAQAALRKQPVKVVYRDGN